jgi:hypothetical protein
MQPEAGPAFFERGSRSPRERNNFPPVLQMRRYRALAKARRAQRGGFSICGIRLVRSLFSFKFVTLIRLLLLRSVGAFVTSYRRGFKDKVWDKYWHWHQRCEAYPTSNCIMQKEKPSYDELCQRCEALSREAN